MACFRKEWKLSWSEGGIAGETRKVGAVCTCGPSSSHPRGLLFLPSVAAAVLHVHKPGCGLGRTPWRLHRTHTTCRQVSPWACQSGCSLFFFLLLDNRLCPWEEEEVTCTSVTSGPAEGSLLAWCVNTGALGCMPVERPKPWRRAGPPALCGVCPPTEGGDGRLWPPSSCCLGAQLPRPSKLLLLLLLN